MSYRVFKKGIGPIFSAYKTQLVGYYKTWSEAHNKMKQLSATTNNFYFWIGDGTSKVSYY